MEKKRNLWVLLTLFVLMSIQSFADVKVHLKKPTAWAKASVYYWNTTPATAAVAWPGKIMTAETNGWYVYTIAGATSANLIFSNNGASQTANLTRNKEGWYSGGVWYDSNPDIVTVVPFKVHFKKPSTYANAYIYFWNSSPVITYPAWPGTAMTAEGNDWYVFTINANSASIIFNNKGTPQTADLTRNKEGWYMGSTWYDTNPEDSTAPTASLTAPAAGNVTGTVTVSATAADNIGVAKVAFYYGTTLISEDTTAPYSVSWNTTSVSNATYALKAVAYDAAGLTGTSATVSVTVNNSTADTTAPVASLTAPTAGTVSATVTVSATATDNKGVTKVGFYYGTTLIAEDTTSPYSVSWNTTSVSNATYALKAVAYDAAGNTGTSATVSVTVNNTTADTTAPVVTLTAPAAGTVSATVTISATATDNKGVTKVGFYYGTTLISEDTTSPYSVSWNTTSVSNGAYVLKAVAYDAAGNTGTSATRSVTVNNTVVSGIKVHFKKPTSYVNPPYVYYWGSTPVTTYPAWPGVLMTLESGNWYVFTIPGVTSSNLIFSDKGTGQTPDLSRTVSESWYANGVWYDKDPDVDTTPPTVEANPAAGKVEPTSMAVTLIGKDDKDTAPVVYYTTNGTTPTTASAKFTTPFTITNVSSPVVVKAFAVDAAGNVGTVVTFNYYMGQDVTAPTVTATPTSGSYETAQNVTLKITDTKDTAPKMYYTTDGSTPTTASKAYAGVIAVASTMTINVLAIDNAGNQQVYNFNYYIGKVTTNRFDPRQESIYFLLTARWFDGDKSNSVGDEFCSWTETRANDNITDDGFTGSDDVTWRGDFKGLVDKMDYIKALGFTSIWITPVVQNRGPLAYHGYHGWDFTKEDARLVSPGYDFKRVVDEAHARGMKICLDIVLNHSGRFGIKNFAEVKYNRDKGLYPAPTEWSGFGGFNETKYQQGTEQTFPGSWQYDGLKSAGTVNGKAIPPYASFAGDVRPFTSTDLSNYPNLAVDKGSNGFLKYQWPSTESYCLTIDGKIKSESNSLTYEQYKNSERRMRGHNTGFPTGSGSFDNFPDAHFDSLHEDCPDLNTENPDVQDYLLNAYYRYIDMGVDMFRVDTVMHIHKQTLNDVFWPKLLARAEQSKAARGGSDFYIFGEVANFVSNPTDKASALREQNYTFDNNNNDTTSYNHLMNGNEYRTPDYSKKAPNASAPYHVGVINMIAHNNFCNGEGGGYGAALNNDRLYNDATFLPWYADSHDYGPNKGATRYTGDFKPLWSMLFTFRGIPIVYYGSEIRFAQGKPNDWPGGGSAGADMSLEKTGRSYYGANLAGSVSATGFGDYTASGQVATSLSSAESQHLMRLNKIRLAVPALQMGQYSTDGCAGGWASFKRRYTGTNTINGAKIDSYAIVGVGSGTHSYSGILNGKYVDCVTGDIKQVTNGTMSFNVPGDNSNLRVYVLDDLTTKAPGKVITASSYIY